MFHMMNVARLSVGLEGLAIAERAYQAALLYAQQRRQGRAVGAPATESSLIVAHPDVRRMLLTMKSEVEAMRCLLYTNAASMDRARHSDDADQRQASQELVELLTPICKAWCTDMGVAVTSLAIQVHGGMGYVEETGVAQHYRDSRIAPIYEGTNGIQAIDLVMRKLPMRGGGVVKDLLASMDALDAELATAGLDAVREGLAAGVSVLRQATDWLLGRVATEPNDALAGATPYLTMFGLVAGGWLLARSALAAQRTPGGENPAGGDRAAERFRREKVATAAFYCQEILPEATGFLPAVTAGAAPLFAVDLQSATLG
jgi:hypothetical protein